MAEKKILTHLKSIGNSELRGWAFERLATDPVAPTDGQVWENTADKVIRFYDGTSVKTLLDTGAAIPKVFGIDLNGALTEVTRAFAGGQTVYTVVHAQNVTNYVPSVKEISTGEEVIADVARVDANTITVGFNGNSTDNTFNLSFVGA